MAMIGKVRRMHFRQGKSVREIVRLTSLSRNTVRKWLKAPLEGEPRYRRSERPGKLSAFHEALQLAFKTDAHRPRHERRTARALHAQIRAEGSRPKFGVARMAWASCCSSSMVNQRSRGTSSPAASSKSKSTAGLRSIQ